MSINRMAQLLDSGEYSDLTLECHGQTFKVHKAIVCAQSPVIAAALRGDFEEARTGTVKIEAFNAETAERMVKFMYGVEYEIDSAEESTAFLGERTQDVAQPLLAHIQVNAAADYYNLPKLGKLANEKIKHLLQTTWSAQGFLDAAKEAFSLTGDTALFKLLASTAAIHLEEIIDMESFAELDLPNDFTLQILRSCVGKLKTFKNLQHAQSQLETDLNHERSWRESEAERAGKAMDNINECLQTLYMTKSCRNGNCTATFPCYIEAHGSAYLPSYTLRCARCRCRHKS
ncbi:BTB/POZ fold protein [Niveomyces insectorum RCEF 264]|uniref:BTB/POZ fold protein n=1 Tax=Niveomyces insectorum RCEF 264 TaxID=1081102 RepID=A0A167WVP6_9HYPO|nr:BTB/POZ fold protein [Niveomyces insectorum RCEF 264]